MQRATSLGVSRHIARDADSKRGRDVTPAPSPCTRLSRAPSTYGRVRLPSQHLLPSGMIHFGRHTRSAYGQTKTTMDLSGSSTLPVSEHAVPSDPAAVSSPHRPLRWPTVAFRALRSRRPADLYLNEAPQLHLRYGLLVALSTLNSCRYLQKPKTRFPVGRLIPLSGAGISPAGSARLVLTHRSAGTRSRTAVKPLIPVVYRSH